MDNLKIAKELVRLAKDIVSSERKMEFHDLINFLEENGWAFHNSIDVKSTDGRTGTRYELSPYPQNLDKVEPASMEDMREKIKGLEEKYINVVESMGAHHHAPEMKQLSVILLD